MSSLEAYFLEPIKLTDEQNSLKLEQTAVLGDHPILKELFDVSIKTHILDLISFVSERKFEEAFAEYKAMEALEDMKQVLQGARETLNKEKQLKVERSKTSNEIKY